MKKQLNLATQQNLDLLINHCLTPAKFPSLNRSGHNVWNLTIKNQVHLVTQQNLDLLINRCLAPAKLPQHLHQKDGRKVGCFAGTFFWARKQRSEPAPVENADETPVIMMDDETPECQKACFSRPLSSATRKLVIMMDDETPQADRKKELTPVEHVYETPEILVDDEIPEVSVITSTPKRMKRIEIGELESSVASSQVSS